jgi:Rod binding domain-containing protein
MIPVSSIGAATPSATPDAKTVGRVGTASKAALAFERQLVTQLTKQLAESMKPAEGDSTSAATGAYLDMLPETLADSVMQGGGLGLAAQLSPAIAEQNK